MDVSLESVPWLLLIFSLPAREASARVTIWRKLQRFGALPLRGSGYVLPNKQDQREQLEWLAKLIRKHRGEASILHVAAIGDLSHSQLADMFRNASAQEYRALAAKVRKIRSTRQPGDPKLGLLRRRFHEVAAVDFFDSPARREVEGLLFRPSEPAPATSVLEQKMTKQFRNRTWLTRPRPKIDRVSSAWLIRRFIDPKSKFSFASDPDSHPAAVPFDMFGEAGFGHRGEDCTFETLVKHFRIKDRAVSQLAQIVHDADLQDEKFGRPEAMGINQVLEGWGKTGMRDSEILKRGMELIDALYRSLS